MRNFIFLLLLSFYLLACNQAKESEQPSPDTKQNKNLLPEVKIDTGDWGGNITMHIVEKEVLAAGIIKYNLLSTYENHPVGFTLFIKQPVGEKVFISDGISLQSTGEPSNNFLKMLAAIYKQPTTNFIFVDSIKVTCVSLMDMQEKNKRDTLVAQYKLFFASEEDGSELFMNIDEAGKTISFPEKDSAYRGGIIKALSK